MRIILAGTNSGCGKTTVTLALMAALRKRGMTVAPCKVGPDYIDTEFHAIACGRMSENLDAHLADERTNKSMLARAESSADIAVIEGVMGYYDGMDAISLNCSTYKMARQTRTPVILVVDASGGAASVAAMVKGFLTLVDESGIAGVLINRVSSLGHYCLVRDAVEHYTGIPCVGYLLKNMELKLSSRHLGLVPAVETAKIEEKLKIAAESISETVDFDAILKIAADVPRLEIAPDRLPDLRGFRLGIAKDAAFHFYYAENLRLLRAAGIELVEFSPLDDARLPEKLDAIYIGGGFPEVFADRLSENASMRKSILDALEGGMRCYAECGGLMYLSKEIDGREMVGFFPIECRMTDRLQRFGYVFIEDDRGMKYPAHEFHHAVAEPIEQISCAYQISKASAPSRKWTCGYRKKNALAGFPHLHFGSHMELIEALFGGKDL